MWKYEGRNRNLKKPDIKTIIEMKNEVTDL